MQHSGVDMSKHAILQLLRVEQLAKFGNKISEVFRRNTSIFSKRNRLGSPFRCAEQTDRFFTHVVDFADTREIITNLIANNARFFIR